MKMWRYKDGTLREIVPPNEPIFQTCTSLQEDSLLLHIVIQPLLYLNWIVCLLCQPTILITKLFTKTPPFFPTKEKQYPCIMPIIILLIDYIMTGLHMRQNQTALVLRMMIVFPVTDASACTVRG